MRILLLVLPLVACTKSTPTGTATDSSPPPPAGQSVGAAMHGNLGGVLAMHNAVIMGDLEGARAGARSVATSPRIEGIPEPWLEYQVAMRTRAAEFSEVTTLKEAASGAVQLGQQCAACHGFLSVGPGFYATPAPPESGEMSEYMQHHAWASDLLWKGLLAPDPDLYTKGALALGEVIEVPPALDESPDPKVVELASEVHALGAQAAGASTERERGETYRDMIVTCAQCHEHVGVRPALSASPTLKAPQDR